jgi:hypothetical protein
MIAIIGARTWASYLSRCALNQSRRLFRLSPRRNVSDSWVKRGADIAGPEDEPVDAVYALVHAAAGLVPGVAELLERIIAPPLVRRQREWMDDIAAAVRRLESERAITPEQLRDNPAFIDAVLTATQAAIRTSQRGKLKALRNAVLNSALPTSPDETQQQIFLAMTDRFTALHLAVLTLFHNPFNWRGADGRRVEHRRTGVAATVLEDAFPGSDRSARFMSRCGRICTELG